MKKNVKLTAVALSAMMMVMSSVPAVAAEKAPKKSDHKVVVDNKEDKEDKEDKKEDKVEDKKEDKVEDKKEDKKEDKVEDKKEDKVEENKEDKEVKLGYSVLEGKIKAVEKNEDGSYKITFENKEKEEIIFNETECMVIVKNELKTLEDLKAGMDVYVAMDDSAPMTLSLPGQTSGAIAFVAAEDVTVAVADFDKELTSPELKLEIGKDTKILDIKGTKSVLTAEDVKDHKALVVYKAATKSIPAQTTPDMVVVIEEVKAEAPVEPIAPVAPVVDEKEAKEENKMVGLRETFEAKGFKIEWTANDKPIILENDKVKVEVEIGKDTMKIGDKEVKLAEVVKIVDGVTFISADAIELVK